MHYSIFYRFFYKETKLLYWVKTLLDMFIALLFHLVLYSFTKGPGWELCTSWAFSCFWLNLASRLVSIIVKGSIALQTWIILFPLHIESSRFCCSIPLSDSIEFSRFEHGNMEFLLTLEGIYNRIVVFWRFSLMIVLVHWIHNYLFAPCSTKRWWTIKAFFV